MNLKFPAIQRFIPSTTLSALDWDCLKKASTPQLQATTLTSEDYHLHISEDPNAHDSNFQTASKAQRVGILYHVLLQHNGEVVPRTP